MYKDHLEAIDWGQVTIVVMFDLCAAFDAIDIPLLNRNLQNEFVIYGIPLKWIKAYFTNRTMKVEFKWNSQRIKLSNYFLVFLRVLVPGKYYLLFVQ